MMTYVTVYKFDCCSRKNALDFLTNVLKDLSINQSTYFYLRGKKKKKHITNSNTKIK